MVILYDPGNLDKSVDRVETGKWYVTGGIAPIAVIIPRIGVYVTYEGKSYVVLRTTTYQEDSGVPVKAIEYPKPDITTKCLLLRIDDEGEDMGEEPIWARVEEIDYI